MGLPFRTLQLASIALQPSLSRKRSSLHRSRSHRLSWSRFLRSLVLVVIFAIATFGYVPQAAYAQVVGSQFDCDGTLYVSRADSENAATQLNRVNTAQNFNLEPIGGAAATYNGAGFRVQNGSIYAIRPNNNGVGGAPRSTVYQIDSNGAITTLGVPTNPILGTIRNEDWFSGDVAPDGTFFVYSPNGWLASIDVTTTPPTLLSQEQLPVPRPALFDIAFNPVNGRIYGFNRTNNQITEITFDFGTRTVTNVANIAPTGQTPTGIVGAVFFDAFGRIFLYENDADGNLATSPDGNLYSSPLGSDVTSGLLELRRPNLESVGNNDGASCPYAPRVSKTADPNPAEAGNIVTYTYLIENSNVIDLSNVRFFDELITNGQPDGRTFVQGSVNFPTIPTDNLVINFPAPNQIEITGIDIPPSTPREFSVQVQIDPATPAGTLFNQGLLETSEAEIVDPNTGERFPVVPRLVARTDDPATPNEFPDPTPVDVTPSTAVGVIGISKQAASTTVNNDGTIDIAYSLIVENVGGVNLNNVQVTEDLTSTFESPATFQIISGPGSPNGFTTNPGFTGTPSGSVELLSGNDSLQVGAQRTINFTVRVTPNGNYGPYQNTAVATGTDPNGGTVTDDSDDGTDPDPNNNGNPSEPDEDTPTVVTPQIADLAVEKGVDNPNPNIGDTITYTITLRNLGPSDTTNVTVQEDLPAGFTATAPAGTTYNAATGVWSIPDLDVGQFVVLTLQGTFDGTPFENVAQVTGSSVPDPNPDNDISRVQVPSVTADLSLEKTLVDADEIAVGDVITFEIELTNSGPDTATNIQITDDFPNGFEFVEARPETGTYDETTNIWSIASLASGESTSLLLTGRLTADSVTNVAEVSSVDQNDPDSTPNNRNPDEDDYGTITVSISPELVLQKRITALVQDGNVTRFTQPAANPLRPEFVGEVTLPPSAQVTSQDVVEYTVYYLASGTTANSVQICDAIPVGTSYVNSTLSTASGSANPTSLTDANDGDGGQFLPALTPAPSPCSNSMNPNGSVLVNVGNVPAGQSGFIRFRSQVN